MQQNVIYMYIDNQFSGHGCEEIFDKNFDQIHEDRMMEGRKDSRKDVNQYSPFFCFQNRLGVRVYCLKWTFKTNNTNTNQEHKRLVKLNTRLGSPRHTLYIYEFQFNAFSFSYITEKLHVIAITLHNRPLRRYTTLNKLNQLRFNIMTLNQWWFNINLTLVPSRCIGWACLDAAIIL